LESLLRFIGGVGTLGQSIESKYFVDFFSLSPFPALPPTALPLIEAGLLCSMLCIPIFIGTGSTAQYVLFAIFSTNVQSPDKSGLALRDFSKISAINTP